LGGFEAGRRFVFLQMRLRLDVVLPFWRLGGFEARPRFVFLEMSLRLAPFSSFWKFGGWLDVYLSWCFWQ
jgi:hypothetical protein